VSDLPLQLPEDVAARLRRAIDREGKILRGLETLGPLAGRDGVVVDGGDHEVKQYAATGARVTRISADGAPWPLADQSVDTVVSAWAGFRGADPKTIAEADRVLRPEGRLLVVHDYGRDDVSRLRGDLPEYGPWSRRDGPFLAAGFRVRVIHCFWTFDSVEDMQAFLQSAFGEVGRSLGEDLRRPRLSYNVAIYHRVRGASGAGDAVGAAEAPVRGVA
jgi:SAM-dependent methyltransferase